MKKYLHFITILIFCLTLNSSSNAYTKKNLENIRKYSAISELVLSMPFLLSQDTNNNNSLSLLSAPADITENLVSSALEYNTHLISEAAIFLKAIKTHNNAEQTLFLLFILKLLYRTSNVITLHISDNRISRRIIRAISIFFIAFTINYLYFTKINQQEFPLSNFICLITSSGIREVVGEIIIRKTEEEHAYYEQ